MELYNNGISNIIWDGINKFLKIYKIGNDTIIKIICPATIYIKLKKKLLSTSPI
jgi:hypothetical protein